MNKQATYKALEIKMIGYADLVGVPVQPVQEKLVPIMASSSLTVKPINSEMRTYTGDLIYVRESVLDRLGQAAKLLVKSQPGLQLQVVYGYRALSVQQKLFQKYKQQLETKYEGDALFEATHRLIAVPEIAGHPTGGAVDIQIVKAGKPIDMGTSIWEFVKDSFTFSPFISKVAQDSRQLLRKVMMEAGFAPFDGEWWHFSYGDKEWAKYYQKPYALYEQTEFNVISKK
jgi:D-alanyl-D-alanine dipeptidase